MARLLSILALASVVGCTSPGNARQVSTDTTAAVTAAPASVAPSPTAETKAPIVSTDARELQRRADRARIAGDSAAPVWMVEVSDFQCPFCARFHAESYAAIRKEYIETGRVKLAYMNFPLPMHEHAFVAAEAALCAGAQGRFWQMHDALFTTQQAWSKHPSPAALFDTLATAVGARRPEFHQCMQDRVMQGLVQQDLDRGTESGVRSTPTFFIGDTAITGAQPLAVFRTVLDTAVARAARGRRSP